VQPHALYQFKQEFRFLANIIHPNLVKLYELFSEGDGWFFTMEIIEGATFFDYLHGSRTLPGHDGRTETLQGEKGRQATPHEPGAHEPALNGSTRTLTMSGGSLQSPEPVFTSPPSVGPTRFVADEQQLREAFIQLARGVRALHAAKVLHRDIKPSNVLVTPERRVVLLDFGLAKEQVLARGDVARPSGEIAGTPAYMAPEQWRGKPESESSDWYSVGTMLYQALTGRLPFSGSPVAQLRAKSTSEPKPPSSLVEGVPPDLDVLCGELLRIDWSARPSGDEVIERLGGSRGPSRLRARAVSSSEEEPRAMLGREPELGALERIFRDSVVGQAVLGCVHGPSGVGKSALVARFLDSLEARGEAIVLRGRCYEREVVPYKAFDSLIDSLRRFLLHLPASQLRALVPPDIHELSRLFPVMGWLPAGMPASNESDALDPQQSRFRAFRALKVLLGRLSSQRPLVLWVDDLQWGDADSARLLSELLSPPGVPQLLFLACYRSEEVETSPFLGELSRLRVALQGPANVRELMVGPLSPEQAHALAMYHLDGTSERTRQWAQVIASESEGSPLFIEQLAHDVKSNALLDGTGQIFQGGTRPTLSRSIVERVNRLPESSRKLLEVAVVAGRPLDSRLAFTAAEVGTSSLMALVLLRSTGFIRVRGERGETFLEICHDRIRESVSSSLAPDVLAAHHRHLAAAIEAMPEPDPEVLAVHHHGAGDLPRAARNAHLAAERASRVLAFERAAELYARALEWSAGGPEDSPTARRALSIRRADALVNAGRGAEAAPLYLHSSKGDVFSEALGLRCRAAEQFLVSGHIDEGIGILMPLLQELGLYYPGGTFGAVGSSVLLLLGLGLRGLRFKERPEAELDPVELGRIDACWAATQGLMNVDPLRASYFQLQHMHLSLGAGEPARVATALSALGVVLLSLGTRRGLDWGTSLLARGQAIAERLDNPFLLAMAAIMDSSRGLVLGDWNESLARTHHAMTLLERCRGVQLWRNCARNMEVYALEALGRFKEVAARTAEWQREAVQLQDIFGQLTAMAYAAPPLLAAHDLEGARRLAREVVALWSRRGFFIQHMHALRIETYAELHEGNPGKARARLLADWPGLRSSQMLQAQFPRLEMLLLRARTALACAAAEGPGGRELLALAEQDARSFEREIRRDTRATASLIRACAARIQGHDTAALTFLDEAISGYNDVQMSLHAASARRAKGVVLGGETGRALIAQADTFLRGLGVENPERWLAAQAPGFG
jgi:serine/threonine protein kinase